MVRLEEPPPVGLTKSKNKSFKNLGKLKIIIKDSKKTGKGRKDIGERLNKKRKKQKYKMSGCRDLRHLHNPQDVEAAFSKLVSGGKKGYKRVIERNKPVPKCDACGIVLLGEEKFCPEHGKKLK